MEGKGFWAETARRVALYQRNMLQAMAARHPAAFLVVWGLKAMLVDVPVALVRRGVSLFKGRKQAGDLVQAGTERT